MSPVAAQTTQPVDNSATATDAQNAAKQALQGAQGTPQDTSNGTASQITAFTPDPYAGSVTVDSASAPGTLTSMGNAQASYQTMVNSQATQPQFDPSAMKDLVTNSNTIAGNPQNYLGVDASGQPVTCQAVPAGSSPPVTYQSTCNTGASIAPQTQSCAEINRVSFTTASVNGFIYLYTSNTQGDTSTDAALAAQVLAGTCQISKSSHLAGCYGGGCFDFWLNTVTCASQQNDPQLYYEQPATFTQTIPTFTKDTSACAAIDSDPSCQQQSEVCTDSVPQTRAVGGNTVTAACWGWQRTSTCNSVVTGNSDCGALQSNTNCRFDHTECLDANPVPGQCQDANQVYVCAVPDQTSNTPNYICTNNITCVNGICNQVAAQPSQDFTKAVAALGTLSAVKSELDPNTITLFEGSASGCHKPLFGIENCCAGGPGIPLIGACSAAERQLATSFSKGVTHYVGSFCSSSGLGVCLSEHETFCVFQSKLGRIIEEQGRPQLGLDFGTAKSPVCDGLTPQQFAQLDLSKFDFSEVLNDLTANVALPDQQTTMTSMQAKIQAYYANHPAN